MREHIECILNMTIQTVILMERFSNEREKYGNVIYSSMSEMLLGNISWVIHSL